MHLTTLTTLLATAGLTAAAVLPKIEVGPVTINDSTATPAAHHAAAATTTTATVFETITRTPTPTATPSADDAEAMMMPAVPRPVITTTAVSPHHLLARAQDWRAARDKAISRGRQAGARGRAKGAEGRRKGQEGRAKGQAARDRGRAEGQAAAAYDNYDNYALGRRGWHEDVASAKSLASSYRSSASSVASFARAEASGAAAEWRDYSGEDDDDDDESRDEQQQQQNRNSTAVPEQRQHNATVVPEPSANATTSHTEPHPSNVPGVQLNGAEAQRVVFAGFAVVAAAFGMM